MQRRTTLNAALSVLAATALAWGATAQAQNAAPRIAVTDLAYAQQVSEYFMAGQYQRSSQMSAQGSQGGGYSHGPYGGSGSYSGQQSMQASEQASGTYVAGRYSYIEMRELGGYTNDIKGAILQGTYFKLVQGRGFDAGAPQNSKAEQVLNQLQGGKMAKPVRQNDVTDVIARLKKGEFKGADYVLFGVVSSIEFTDALSPLQGTTSATAQGAGNDTKILSNRGDIAPPNRSKVMKETSMSLANDVYQQLAGQLGYTDANLSRGVRRGQPMPMQQGGEPVREAPPEQVIILR